MTARNNKVISINWKLIKKLLVYVRWSGWWERNTPVKVYYLTYRKIAMTENDVMRYLDLKCQHFGIKGFPLAYDDAWFAIRRNIKHLIVRDLSHLPEQVEWPDNQVDTELLAEMEECPDTTDLFFIK